MLKSLKSNLHETTNYWGFLFLPWIKCYALPGIGLFY